MMKFSISLFFTCLACLASAASFTEPASAKPTSTSAPSAPAPSAASPDVHLAGPVSNPLLPPFRGPGRVDPVEPNGPKLPPHVPGPPPLHWPPGTPMPPVLPRDAGKEEDDLPDFVEDALVEIKEILDGVVDEANAKGFHMSPASSNASSVPAAVAPRTVTKGQLPDFFGHLEETIRKVQNVMDSVRAKEAAGKKPTSATNTSAPVVRRGYYRNATSLAGYYPNTTAVIDRRAVAANESDFSVSRFMESMRNFGETHDVSALEYVNKYFERFAKVINGTTGIAESNNNRRAAAVLVAADDSEFSVGRYMDSMRRFGEKKDMRALDYVTKHFESFDKAIADSGIPVSGDGEFSIGRYLDAMRKYGGSKDVPSLEYVMKYFDRFVKALDEAGIGRKGQ